ncbi:MAG: RMD1 family protein, partial [Deltaproteobacteria bacterium]|nr:RMD1 family protein [Deltaproteobacteria bacterium]
DTKNQIIAALAVLDKPAVTWESESLDRLYRDLRLMLEIDDRFRALEYKLRTIQETLELFLEMSQTRRMIFLEATIVVLIVVELLLTLLEKAW